MLLKISNPSFSIFGFTKIFGLLEIKIFGKSAWEWIKSRRKKVKGRDHPKFWNFHNLETFEADVRSKKISNFFMKKLFYAHNFNFQADYA